MISDAQLDSYLATWEIMGYPALNSVTDAEVAWLIGEVRRLRKIETAAREIPEPMSFGRCAWCAGRRPLLAPVDHSPDCHWRTLAAALQEAEKPQ